MPSQPVRCVDHKHSSFRNEDRGDSSNHPSLMKWPSFSFAGRAPPAAPSAKRVSGHGEHRRSISREERIHCGVCLKRPSNFAILESCNHVLCVPCLRTRRRVSSENGTAHQDTIMCPSCHVKSPSFISSPHFVDEGLAKTKLFQESPYALCSICYEKPSSYALLESCDHTFCIPCIAAWTDSQQSETSRWAPNSTQTKCPLCRVDSAFCIPYPTFYVHGCEKLTIMSRHLAQLCTICLEKPESFTLMDCCPGVLCTACAPTSGIGMTCPCCSALNPVFATSWVYFGRGPVKASRMRTAKIKICSYGEREYCPLGDECKYTHRGSSSPSSANSSQPTLVQRESGNEAIFALGGALLLGGAAVAIHSLFGGRRREGRT